MRELLLFLHILASATWLGAALWTPGDVRRSLAAGRAAADGLARRAGPAIGLDLAAGAATIVTGLVLIAVLGGHPGTGILVGLGAALLRFLLVLLAFRPAWHRVAAALEPGGELAAAEAPARRLGMLSGIGHLLWMVALAGMIWR